MDEETAAFIYKIAPRDKPSEWTQRALKRVLTNWKQTRPDDFQTIIESKGFGYIVGFEVVPNDIGQYGYDTDFRFSPDAQTRQHLSSNYDRQLDQEEGGDLVEAFYTQWINELHEVISDEQEQTMFSAKEFATFFAHRHPNRGERRNADALDIAVGTYRGKVGRIKSKLDTARNTLQLDESYPQQEDYEDWKRETYHCPISVLHRVDTDRLPVDARERYIGDKRVTDEFPVEDLTRE